MGTPQPAPLPSLHLSLRLPYDFARDYPPFSDAFRSQGGFLSWFSHPELVLSLVQSGRSAINLGTEWGLHRLEAKGLIGPESRSLRRRLVKVGVLSIGAGYGSYLAHETGHFEHLLIDEEAVDRFDFDNPAGINASLWASQELLYYPYEGVGSDLAYIFHKMDLPFYLAVQEQLASMFFEDGSGDMGDYRQFREEKNGSDEAIPLALLGAWHMVDLVGPASRVIRYLRSGDNPSDPNKPGHFRWSTTGTVAPTGPLFGLRLNRFLAGHSSLPAAIAAEAWSSPVTQGTSPNPFGFQLALRRVPMPVTLLGGQLAISGHFTFFGQQAAWRDPEDQLAWRGLVMAAGGGVHLQRGEGEVVLSGRYKEEGFLPNERYEDGWQAMLGLQLAL